VVRLRHPHYHPSTTRTSGTSPVAKTNLDKSRKIQTRESRVEKDKAEAAVLYISWREAVSGVYHDSKFSPSEDIPIDIYEYRREYRPLIEVGRFLKAETVDLE